MDVALDKKIGGYKQIALEKLEHILLTIFGRKDLVVEPDMIRILDSFANMTWLKSKGFERIFKLSSSLPPKTRTLVFMIFANLVTFKHVIDQIQVLKSSSPHTSEIDAIKEFHIIIVPDLYFTFRHLLESEGLAGVVSLHRFSWDFIKVDQNLLLLEIPNTFQKVFIQRDKSVLSAIANSLKIFNIVHKRPNLVFTVGENSEKVIEMVSRMESARKVQKREDDQTPDFNAMIVIDRDADYPSCLLTPVTYSGLMLELYDMKAGVLSIEGENKISSGKVEILKDPLARPSDEQADVKTLRMCGTSDEFYTRNKHNHFADVVTIIKTESKSIELEQRKYSRDMNLEQMKDFVERNLPRVAAQKKVLYKHLVICERIVQEMSLGFERLQNVEEMIVRGENRKQVLAFVDESVATSAHRFNVLRLVALFHIFSGAGFTGEELNKIVSSYLNAFGHRHLYVFHNLHRAKLFPDILRATPKHILQIASNLTKKSPFMVDALKLRLIPSSENNAEGEKQKVSKACPSYVFNGNFVPLVAQLASVLLKAENLSELVTKFAGVDMKIQGSGGELRNLRDANEKTKCIPFKPKTLFIFVIGGVSYAEVAACKIVESLTGSTIVLASDEVTSGANLIKSAM